MIENIGAYSQVDYDRGYQQGRADGFQQGVDDTAKRYKDSYMARDIKQIKTDYLNEIIDILNDSFPMTPNADITCGYYCAIQRLEQLKEQKNES